MDQVEFLSLPDYELLVVLSYLSPEDLLQCRKVCRRLRETCLHPKLWRSVRLFYDGSTDAGVLPILRLAPCLREVYLCRLDLDAVATIMSRSSCVVKKLVMDVDNRIDVARAIVILQRMYSLGGLEALRIDFGPSTTEIEPLVYVIVYSLNNLTELSLSSYSLPNRVFGVEGIEPSLTSLNFTISGWSNCSCNILQTLLMGHAATLTTLHLDVRKTYPMSLLKMIPNLRSLSCSPTDALAELHSANFLEEIRLSCDTNVFWTFPPGALEFLRGAPHLRRVSISLLKENSAAPLLALSESPSASTIESLYLSGYWTDECSDQLAAALLQFRSLHTLSVRPALASISLLRALTSSSTPHLKMLTVVGPKDVCLHNWLHGPAGDLLARSPCLHLRVASMTVPAMCRCLWCEWGCHPELKKGTAFAFSSHQREVGCPLGCFQVALLPKCASCDL